MSEQPYQINDNQRVRLKGDGQDGLYSMACAGSEGWVREHKRDSHGYPLVFIEWDEDHWTYNGEPNKWTFESHFESVGEQMEDPKVEQFKKFTEMFQQFLEAQGDEKTDEGGQSEATHPPASETIDIKQDEALSPLVPVDSDEAYQKLLQRVIEMVKSADSFVIAWVERDEDDGIPVITPRLSQSYKSVEGGILLEAQIARFSTVAHDLLAMQAISRELRDK